MADITLPAAHRKARRKPSKRARPATRPWSLRIATFGVDPLDAGVPLGFNRGTFGPDPDGLSTRQLARSFRGAMVAAEAMMADGGLDEARYFLIQAQRIFAMVADRAESDGMVVVSYDYEDERKHELETNDGNHT